MQRLLKEPAAQPRYGVKAEIGKADKRRTLKTEPRVTSDPNSEGRRRWEAVVQELKRAVQSKLLM